MEEYIHVEENIEVAAMLRSSVIASMVKNQGCDNSEVKDECDS